MEFVTDGVGRLVLKSWIDQQELFEDEKLTSQTVAVGSLPMAYHHVALMPDAHAGFGMPIGGVLALDGALCPSAVGYDIGCGMVAVHTDLPIEELKPVRVEVNRLIRKAIPVGVNGERSEPSDYAHLFTNEPNALSLVNTKVENKRVSQLGTLGAGNHFIEFDYDATGDVWVVIHSGSRGVGHAIADHYMKLAERRNATWWSQVPKDLACLPVASVEGAAYKNALAWALDWAWHNRYIMTLEVLRILFDTFGQVHTLETINVHHNDANLEHHFGRDVWVHRKGATRAREGERLVIPGNMGQGSAICTGKGNPDSFYSSSHGAGRRLGRNEAKRTLDPEACAAELAALDVVLSCGRDGALDEMPAAYKDFEVVMGRQADLVECSTILMPASVIKG